MFLEALPRVLDRGASRVRVHPVEMGRDVRGALAADTSSLSGVTPIPDSYPPPPSHPSVFTRKYLPLGLVFGPTPG